LDVPKTYDLRALVENAPSGVASLFELNEVLALNRYSVEARYPEDWEPIWREDAERAIGIAKEVRATVRAVLAEGAV
jgi:HEPN domain-containing protein